MFVAFLISVIICQSVQCERYPDFILLGSTGNLAKKYLWQSVFEVVNELGGNYDERGTVFGGYIHTPPYYETINSSINGPIFEKHDFIMRTKTIFLSKNSDYYDSCWNQRHLSRVFYAAIPTSAFKEVLHSIWLNCVGVGTVDVALEKPIGEDIHKFYDLHGYIKRLSFSGFTVHYVDHYSAKPALIGAVDWIFGRLKHELKEVHLFLLDDKDLSTNLASYVTINGVVADVVQNHASVVLTALLSHIGTQSKGWPILNSADVLANMTQPIPIWVGQYNHLDDEMIATFGNEHEKKTPATAILTNIQYQRDKDQKPLEIFVAAGKASKQKLTFLKLSFGDQTADLILNLANPSQHFPELVLGLKDSGNQLIDMEFEPHCVWTPLTESFVFYTDYATVFGCDFTTALYNQKLPQPYTNIVRQLLTRETTSHLRYTDEEGKRKKSQSHALKPTAELIENQWKLWNSLAEQVRDMDPVSRVSYQKFSNQLYEMISNAMKKYKGVPIDIKLQAGIDAAVQGAKSTVSAKDLGRKTGGEL